MKIAVMAFAVAGLLAGSASAASKVSDVDYMKAARCKGIAAGLGSDTSALSAFLKTEGASRQSVILDQGDAEMTRGKRDASKSDLKDRVSAELAGPCMAYTGGKDTPAGR